MSSHLDTRRATRRSSMVQRHGSCRQGQRNGLAGTDRLLLSPTHLYFSKYLNNAVDGSKGHAHVLASPIAMDGA